LIVGAVSALIVCASGSTGRAATAVPTRHVGTPADLTLRPYGGPTTIEADDTVIDGALIKGGLRITGRNVTVRNSRIEGTGPWGIDADVAEGLKVLDTTLRGPGTTNSGILTGNNWTVERTDISGWENGIMAQGGTGRAVGNYIHDLEAGPDGHYDCIQFEGPAKGVLIEDNDLFGRDTSDLFFQTLNGPIEDVTIRNNRLAGTPGYAIYVQGRNFRIIGNKIALGGWKEYLTVTNDSRGAIVEFSGNTDFHTGWKIGGG
jgi:hypothetical protein